jgi:hypothetical protein
MINIIVMAATAGMFTLWILAQRSYIKVLQDRVDELRTERDLLLRENIELNNEVLGLDKRAPNRE